jgi:hypothetical protein
VLLLFGTAGGIRQIVAERSNSHYYGFRTQFNVFQRGFWPVFGICLLAVAIGRSGRFLARGDACLKTKESETLPPQHAAIPHRRFQFSLFRLLLATTVCALVFGLSRMYFGRVPSIYYWFSGMIAAAQTGMVLFASKEHLARIAMSLVLGVFGALVGFALTPMITTVSPLWLPEELYVVVPSVVVFWIIGCLLSRWDERIQRNGRK